MDKKIHQLMIFKVKMSGDNLADFIKMPKTYEGIVYDLNTAPYISFEKI